MSLDDQLAELWAAGATLTEIGLQMGVSRSVVAGRLARARARRTDDPRLAPRPRPPKVMPAPRVRSVKPGHEVIGNAPPPVPPRPRLLVDLGPRDCRWAVGEAADGRHLMWPTSGCGATVLRHSCRADCGRFGNGREVRAARCGNQNSMRSALRLLGACFALHLRREDPLDDIPALRSSSFATAWTQS